LPDGEAGLLLGKQYLIHDRDPLFTEEFLGMLAATGGKSVKLPPQSPNWNADAERFVPSIKESCLEKLIWLGERPCAKGVQELRSALSRGTNHQGLGNRLIQAEAGHLGASGEMQRRQRLGGLLNYYYRAAARLGGAQGRTNSWEGSIRTQRCHDDFIVGLISWLHASKISA
jgi:hypothetical protein